jgi:uncharacterized protein (DUF1778 family)
MAMASKRSNQIEQHATLPAADKVAERGQTISLSPRDSVRILKLLYSPPPPTPALLAAARRRLNRA